jgi:hypothetical protein
MRPVRLAVRADSSAASPVRSSYAVRGRRRGQVERPSGGRAPVDEQRTVLGRVVEEPDPPDVSRLVVVEVQTAEAEPVFHRAGLGDLLGVEGDAALPLGTGLRGAAGLPQEYGQPTGCLLPHLVEPVVQPGDVFLLAGNVGRVT